MEGLVPSANETLDTRVSGAKDTLETRSVEEVSAAGFLSPTPVRICDIGLVGPRSSPPSTAYVLVGLIFPKPNALELRVPNPTAMELRMAAFAPAALNTVCAAAGRGPAARAASPIEAVVLPADQPGVK